MTGVKCIASNVATVATYCCITEKGLIIEIKLGHSSISNCFSYIALDLGKIRHTTIL